MPDEWVRVDAYHITCGKYTICKYGGPGYKYALWDGQKLVKFSNDLEELKTKVRENDISDDCSD